MASVTFYLLNGTTKHFGPGIRVSGPTDKNGTWLGKFWVWPSGPHRQGSKPIYSVRVEELHSKKKTGRKGIEITKY